MSILTGKPAVLVNPAGLNYSGLSETLIKPGFLKSMRYNGLIITSLWLAIMMVLPACSSLVPPEIRQVPDTVVSVQQVREQADDYVSQKVRWGGVILKTENKNKTSWITVIAQPLTKSGKPRISDQSPGRFIAIVNEFVEPLVYSRDRRITLTGNISGTEVHNVGEFPYEYPIIKVDNYYLWPLEKEPKAVNYPPYWRYDPWFYPDYYPWPYYPYRLNPYHR